MTTGATGQLGLALPVQGELSGTWGDTVNNGITQYTNIAIAATLTLTGDGAVTLANTTGDASASNITATLAGAGTVTAQFAIVQVSGTTTTKVITGPSYSKTYVVDNSSSYAVTFKASGQTGVSVAAAEKVTVFFNGTDYVKIAGTIANAAGSNTQIQFNNGGLFGASANLTWDGTTLSSTQVNITGQGTLRLQDTTGGEYVGLRSPSALGASYTLTFPADDGTSGQALITDGSGVLSWSTAASGDVYGPASATDKAIATFDGTTGKLIQNNSGVTITSGILTATGFAGPLNGTVGATTPTTGAFTTVAASGSVTLSGGTANGVTYLNGSKVLTSGSALTFDGTNLLVGTASSIFTTTVLQATSATTQVAGLKQTGGASNTGLTVWNTGTTGPIYQHKFAYGAGGSLSGSITTDSSGNTSYNSEGSVVFGYSGTTEGMRLTSTGLGIGTSSPSAKLDVYAGGNGTGVRISNPTFGSNASPNYTELFFGLQNYSTGYAASIRGYNSGLDNFNAFLTFNTCSSNSAPTERMRITSAGDVGIGTSSPGQALSLARTAGTSAFISIAGNGNTPATAEVLIGQDTSSNAYLYNRANAPIIFGVNNAEGMRLTSTGLGIGTSSPAYKLDAQTTATGTAAGDNTAGYFGSLASGRDVNIRFGDNVNASARLGYLSGSMYMYTNGAERLRITSAGELILGGTSALLGQSGSLVIEGNNAAPFLSLFRNDTTVSSGNGLGVIRFYGNDTTSNTATVLATITAEATAAHAAGDNPTALVFGTTAAGSATVTERMRLDSSGNLGIGTTSPSYLTTLYKATLPVLQLANSTSGSTSSDGLLIYLNGSNAMISNQETGYLAFETAATTRATIDSSGNLGLGVTPSAWNAGKVLEIGGVGSFIFGGGSTQNIVGTNSYYNSGWKYAATGRATQYEQSAGVHYWYNSASGTAGNAITFSQAMTLDASGNLGIGTTSPSINLEVKNTGTLQFKFGTTGSSAGFQAYTGSGVSGAMDFSYTAGTIFYVSNNAGGVPERARIDSSGRLLVGLQSTSLSAKIVIQKDNGSPDGMAINQDSGGAGISFYGSATTAIFSYFVTSAGNSGQISGNGVVTSYTSVSDYRLKNTITPMTGALAKVALLKPCTYKWNSNGDDGQGFIAHELAEVCPQAVTGEKDAVDANGKPQYQGVDTSFLVATLTAAIQELKAEFDAYKASHP